MQYRFLILIFKTFLAKKAEEIKAKPPAARKIEAKSPSAVQANRINPSPLSPHITQYNASQLTHHHINTMTISHSPADDGKRIHPKAPVKLIFIAIFTCLPSCINLSNIELVRNELDAVNCQLPLTSWKTRKIANCAMKM